MVNFFDLKFWRLFLVDKKLPALSAFFFYFTNSSKSRSKVASKSCVFPGCGREV
jgi:hypothetical protein